MVEQKRSQLKLSLAKGKKCTKKILVSLYDQKTVKLQPYTGSYSTFILEI